MPATVRRHTVEALAVDWDRVDRGGGIETGVAVVAADWLRDRQNATSLRSQLTPDGPRRPAS